MRIWKVRVRCLGEKPPKKLGGAYKPVSWHTVVLLESSTADEAMAAGKSYGEARAPTSCRWTEICAMSAVSVNLPILVESL